VAFSRRPDRSAFQATALKRGTVYLTNLAPRFPAERAKPSIAHLLNWPGYFVRYGFNRPDPVALSRPLSFLIQKSPKFLPMTWVWVGVYRKANTKWSALLPQCEQRTRGAIRNFGRRIPGTRAGWFSGPAHSLGERKKRNSSRLPPPIQVRSCLIRWILGSVETLKAEAEPSPSNG
jgi:hypothetical protein